MVAIQFRPAHYGIGGSGTFTPSNTDVKATYIPTAAEVATGNVTLTLLTTGNGNCNVVTDMVDLIFTPAPIVDAGIDQVVCVDDLDISITGTVAGPTASGQWSTNGTGLFVPADNLLNTTYRASSQDSLTGSVRLYLTSTNNGICVAQSDSVDITILPAGNANAGTDVNVCANDMTVALNGAITGSATSGVWSTSGSGAFVPDENTLNANYVPSATDSVNGTVTLTLTANSCNMATDDMIIDITPAPRVNAGSDQTSCVTNLTINLGGSVSGASITGEWNTSGSGTFVPNNTDLNAQYIASSADSISEGVKLILSATNTGSCAVITDTMSFDIFASGVVSVGVDQAVCGNNADVSISGTVTGGATRGIWRSSGSGLFAPTDTSLTATYTPSANDIIAGSVMLTLNATNSCNPTSDSLEITFNPSPIADAGQDQVICGTNPLVNLTGSVNGATGALWSSSGSGSFSNDNFLNTTYTASLADLDAGSLWIYLTTTGNGDCNAVMDSMEVRFTNGIQVATDPDQVVCVTASSTNISGVVSNGTTTGEWSTTGSGAFFPDNQSLNTQYVFGGSDTAVGVVQLILTSTNNGTCAEEKDTLTVTFGDAAFADAGTNISICESNLRVPINGFVSGGATAGVWSSLGTGTFDSLATDLSTIYVPSDIDSIQGSVRLVLNTTDHGQCLQGTDTLTISLDRLPQADAGANVEICPNTIDLLLSGSVANATGGRWSTMGNGTFAVDSLLSTTYTFTANDLANMPMGIILTSTGNFTCSADLDTMYVTVDNSLTASFDPKDICEGGSINFGDSSTATSGVIVSWTWDFGDGNTSAAQHPTHSYSSAGINDVMLVVESSLGCVDSVTHSLEVHALPQAGFSVQTEEIRSDLPISFLDESTGADSWSWTFGDGIGTSQDNTPIYIYADEGLYQIVQTVRSDFGCADSAALNLDVLGKGVFAPKAPTGFTPNGDGKNEIFYVRGGPFTELKFTLYNKWGEVIFESVDQQLGWDGTYKGKNAPVGVYVYTIEATTTDGNAYSKTGKVTLIR